LDGAWSRGRAWRGAPVRAGAQLPVTLILVPAAGRSHPLVSTRAANAFFIGFARKTEVLLALMAS